MLRGLDLRRARTAVAVAVLVGALGGLAAALLATATVEPAIEAAVAVEEARSPAGAHDDPVVSRSTQRGVGLFAGYALTGAALGLVFGGVFALGARGGADPFRRSLGLGAALAGAVTLMPWLKYPPNPPAVGDPSTLAQRQGLYAGFVVVSAVLLFGAAFVWRRLRRSGWSEHTAAAVVASVVVVGALAVLGLFPPPPDPVDLSAGLVWRFRLASLGANLLLWAVLAFGFGLVASEARSRRLVG